MTLAASSQRPQVIRSRFRSVLQLWIHRRNQDPTSDLDPSISAPGPALAPAPFLFGPGVLLPEPEHCPWRCPQQFGGPARWEPALKHRTSHLLFHESPKVSSCCRAPKPQATLTFHQYRPADHGARGEPSRPPPRSGTSLQQPSPRMKPAPLTSSPPGVPSPLFPSHKLELQILKLEELTVSELRQQLRLRGLPVSGTKSTLLERMRGGTLCRERQKQLREEKQADTPWRRLRHQALGTAPRQSEVKANPAPPRPPLPRPADALVTAPAPALTPSSAPAPAVLTWEEELQEAIPRTQLLPSRDDILEDQVDPDDLLLPIPLDFPGSFDVLSPSPDSEGLSSVFSSSLSSLRSRPR